MRLRWRNDLEVDEVKEVEEVEDKSTALPHAMRICGFGTRI